jgi:hypothetical protein
MNSTRKSPDQASEDSFDAIVEGLEEHSTRIAVASELLPAWFVPRMMDDVWQFGLMLTSGSTLGISQINRVIKDATGNLWIDATMLVDGMGENVLTAPCPERPNISINAWHIVAAFELAST